MELWEQPTSHALSVFKEYPADTSFSSWKVAGRLTLWVLVLLLVPSLNLNGLIASRMESRLPEMGVRKSFGASRSALLSQVMWENFFLTLVGGLLGLLVAWIMLYVGRGWILCCLIPGQWIFRKEPICMCQVKCCLHRSCFSSPFIVSGAEFAFRFVAGMDVVAQADCVFIV